jgi:MFS family permease
MIVPLYQAELAHPSIRGRVTALQQFMLGVGALCAAWISYGTYIGFPETNHAQWRVPLGLQMVPAIVLGCLILLFPEVRIPRLELFRERPRSAALTNIG